MAKPNSGFLDDVENPGPNDPTQKGYIITQCPCCNEETYFFLAGFDKKRDGRWVTTLACRPRDNGGESFVRQRRPRHERVG